MLWPAHVPTFGKSNARARAWVVCLATCVDSDYRLMSCDQYECYSDVLQRKCSLVHTRWCPVSNSIKSHISWMHLMYMVALRRRPWNCVTSLDSGVCCVLESLHHQVRYRLGNMAIKTILNVMKSCLFRTYDSWMWFLPRVQLTDSACVIDHMLDEYLLLKNHFSYLRGGLNRKTRL